MPDSGKFFIHQNRIVTCRFEEEPKEFPVRNEEMEDSPGIDTDNPALPRTDYRVEVESFG